MKRAPIMQSNYSLSTRELEPNIPGMFQKNKYDVDCAFHSHQKITNFCKDPDCLLPLCPKCIKVHSEQHIQMGTHGKFDSIEECLEEAHESYVNFFSDVSRLQKISFEMESSYKAENQRALNSFQDARELAFEYLAGVFNEYEEAIKIQLAQNERCFKQELIKYHQQIGKIMEKCRIGTKKLQNKQMLMEGLINFYMQHQLHNQLKVCEEGLTGHSVNKLIVVNKEHQLQNLDLIIQKYIRFQGDGDTVQKILANNFEEKESRHNQHLETTRLIYGNPNIPLKVNHNLDNSYLNNSQNRLESMESPLDNFNLEKSRNIRRNLAQRKSSILH